MWIKIQSVILRKWKYGTKEWKKKFNVLNIMWGLLSFEDTIEMGVVTIIVYLHVFYFLFPESKENYLWLYCLQISKSNIKLEKNKPQNKFIT